MICLAWHQRPRRCGYMQQDGDFILFIRQILRLLLNRHSGSHLVVLARVEWAGGYYTCCPEHRFGFFHTPPLLNISQWIVLPTAFSEPSISKFRSCRGFTQLRFTYSRSNVCNQQKAPCSGNLHGTLRSFARAEMSEIKGPVPQQWQSSPVHHFNTHISSNTTCGNPFQGQRLWILEDHVPSTHQQLLCSVGETIRFQTLITMNYRVKRQIDQGSMSPTHPSKDVFTHSKSTKYLFEPPFLE